MITGFQAQMEVDDGASNASVKFAGLTTFNLPSKEAGKFNATELDQKDGSDVTDPYERELPTGLIQMGTTKGELKYTKANYLRIDALVGVRDHVFVLTSPDDQTSGTPTKLLCTFTGFVSKLDDVKYEKGTPVSIPFEITVQQKPTIA